MLEIRLLGRFELRSNGEPIALPLRQAQSLLAYLLLNSGMSHRREKVAGMLWPDSDETQARSKLRYALWHLRKTLGGQYFLADKISLAFNLDSDYWSDITIFDEKKPERLSMDELRGVVAVYEGELLPGFYEDWVILERERLQASYEHKLQLLLQRLMDDQRWREVLDLGEQWISFGQSPEPAFRALMVAHSQLGDVSSAASAYQRCEQTLYDDLGVKPSEETQKIFEIIIRGEKPVVSVLDVPPEAGSKQHVSYQAPAFLEVAEDLPKVARSIFVARENELDLLERNIEKAFSGRGRVVFVVGDAGRGKTALLHEFSRHAQRIHDELVVALGSGEAHIGIGDPHLPFRDILSLLSGDVETKWNKGVITHDNARRLWNLFPQTVDALLEQGPDLIDSFVSGESMRTRGVLYSSQETGWLDRLEIYLEHRRGRPAPLNIEHGDHQKDLFEQYTKVLQRLARRQPLLLVLDDLQWADVGSISLLFHLGRRIEGCRILIVGAFRPDEVAQSRDGKRHPLVQVITEFRRTFGEIEIDLDRTNDIEGRQFVDAFLDTEPNKLGEDFRQALHLHTGGHPLFTIELLRQMEAQGDLQKDDAGRWVESSTVGWDTLPAKVEAVIAGRVNRLPTALKDILSAASIEGEEFTAEVIAKVEGISALEVVHQLSRELDKRHILVEAMGIQRLGQQRLSLYRFRHHLFHKYIYDSLDEVERPHLHEKVGEALETLYGGQTGQVAVRLARHFEAAGVNEKAVEYLLQAGDRAKRLSANEEAIIHLNNGVNLLKWLPESPVRIQKELALQISLGAPLVATRGYTAPEVERTFERARELCEMIGETQQLAPALWGLWSFYLVRAKHSTAQELAEQIHTLAQTGENPDLLLISHWTLGITLTHLGEFLLAREHLDQAIDIYDSERHRPLTYLFGQNPGVTCLNYLALTLWILGYPDQALEMGEHAISLAEEISHPFSQSFAHGMVAVLHALRKDAVTALHHSQEAISVSKEAGFPFLLALGFTVRGWARAELGKTSMAINLMRNAIESMLNIGAELGRPFFLSLLAEAYGKAGQIDEGLRVLDNAIYTANENVEMLTQSDLYRLKGELLEIQDEAEAKINACFLQAIEIARQQSGKSLELRGAMGMSSFWERRGQHGKARKELAEIYAWFTEGFDTEDLLKAQDLLEEE